MPLEYGQVIRDTVGDLGCEIEIEPGRNIVGNDRRPAVAR
ncbi:hypothetical protein MGSAQ_001849, partial [marine sediment metagenome]